MQLWKHPNGIWYVLYGERLQRRVSTRTADRRKAEGFLSRFIAGADTAIELPLVGKILGAYEADRLRVVRSKETLKDSVKVLRRAFEDLEPGHLLPAVIRKYADERGAAAGTILREIGVLRAALAWAVENRWIETKPVISNPVKAPKPRERWITKDEARAILGACRESHVKAFIEIGLMTGARSGAILEAKWDQVNWDQGFIDFGTGHGNKRRSVAPLNDELRAVLTGLKELACSPFVIEWHGKPVKHVRAGFAAACRRAGVDDVTPHALRHSAATWMALDGVPMREIARMLGDSEETVERVYAKYHPDYLRRAAAALQLRSAGA